MIKRILAIFITLLPFFINAQNVNDSILIKRILSKNYKNNDTAILKRNKDTLIYFIVKKVVNIPKNKTSDSSKIVTKKIKTDSISKISPWKCGFTGKLNFNQILISNWAKGGENALSGIAFADLFANYKHNEFSFENTADLAYGLMFSRDRNFQKNEDKIDITSKLDLTAFRKWHYSFLANVKTQFDKGYKYPDDSTIVSTFLAPGYATVSLGMDYKIKNFFSLFISPASGKFTLVLDQRLADLGSFGVTPAKYDTAHNIIKRGRNFKAEFGINVISTFKKEIFKNINYSTKVEFHNNYFDVDKSNRWNFDVNWENSVNFMVNSHFSTLLYTHLIYDDDIRIPDYEYIDGKKVKVGNGGPKLQFKETFGIGITYKI